jgi:hypothetical protein
MLATLLHYFDNLYQKRFSVVYPENPSAKFVCCKGNRARYNTAQSYKNFLCLVKFGFYVKIFKINTGHYNEIRILFCAYTVLIQRSAFERIDSFLTKQGFRWAAKPACETDTHRQLHEQ